MAYVNPELQRQVQGLTVMRPSQKAVMSGSALAGALARTRGAEDTSTLRVGRQLQRGKQEVSDIRRGARRERRDITGANIIGGVDVAAGFAAARQRAILAAEEEEEREEINYLNNALINYINEYPDRFTAILRENIPNFDID